MNNDDLEVAKLAAMVSGNLKKVDSETVNPSATSGPANKINPRNFIKQPVNYPIQRERMVYQPLNNQSEILEKVSIDTKALEIPIPDDIKQYVEKYQQPVIQPSPIPMSVTPTPTHTSTSNTISNTDILNMILTYIENVDNKLDLIIKKTKIQSKRMKKVQYGRQRNLAK